MVYTFDKELAELLEGKMSTVYKGVGTTSGLLAQVKVAKQRGITYVVIQHRLQQNQNCASYVQKQKEILTKQITTTIIINN